MRQRIERYALALGCAAALAAAASCGHREAKLIPTEVLFGSPAKGAPMLSPDAKRLAYTAPFNGVSNVWVKTIGRDDDRVLTRENEVGIKRFQWTYDTRRILYPHAWKGTPYAHLFEVDVDTGEIRDLTPLDSASVDVIDYSKRFPDALVLAVRAGGSKLADAYRLDLDTGKLTLLAKNPGNVARWLADADFAVRGATVYRPQGGWDLIARETTASPWKRIASWDFEQIGSSGALRFTRDGLGIYCLDSRGRNTGALVRISIADSSVQVIAGDPRYEIYQAFLQIDTYEMQAVAFARDHVQWTVLDSTLQKDFDALGRLDRGDFEFYSGDASDSTWVVGYYRDDDGIAYYLYERKTGRGTRLFDENPRLAEYTLARMEPVSFTARDGLEIHGYLTCPPGAKRKNLPLVLRVHQGPWTRDFWGYNPEVQWLANRGYACLQVNYRGSRGYGQAFLHAGNRELGGKMEEDLIDGVKWAVDRGIADPKRIGIFGAGYGGYAVLAGVAGFPGTFACGVDISGPADLARWLETLAVDWGGGSPVLYKRVGDPRTDAALLRARSPLFAAEKIRTPLLISQGGNDPYVPTSDAERVVAALNASGVPCQYLFFPDEGAGIYRAQNRLKFWAAAETFLAAHLGGRSHAARP